MSFGDYRAFMGPMPGLGFGRFLGDERGSMAFEFALLVPVLLVLMFGAIQYGTMLYTYNLMLNSARSAVRAVAVGTLSADDAASAVEGTLPPWVAKGDVKVVATDVGANNVQLQITVPGASAAVVTFAPTPTNLVARAIMMREG